MPLAGPALLSREDDAIWLKQFGLDIHDFIYDDLQECVDADHVGDRSSRSRFRALLWPDKYYLDLDFSKRSVSSCVFGMRDLAALGIDTPTVVGKDPSAVASTYEGLKAKIETMESLGLDALAVVNKDPGFLKCQPERLILTAFILQVAGVWERTRDRWNSGAGSAILWVPIESLILSAGLEADRFQQDPISANKFAKSHGLVNTADRKGALYSRLGLGESEVDSVFAEAVGVAGIFYIAREMDRAPLTIASFVP